MIKPLALLLLAAVPSFAAETYRFGFVPEMKKEELQAKWGPFLDVVSKEAGVQLTLDTKHEDTSSFYADYLKGGYDFAFVNPHVFAVRTEKGMYHAFARQDAYLQGVIAVLDGSPYKSLAELAGKRIVFPSKESYAATLLTRIDLKAAGAEPGEESVAYAGGHDKAYAALLEGKADASGGIMRTFLQLKPEDRKRLRVLHTTEPSVPHAIVVHQRVPAAVRRKVQAAFVKLSADPKGYPLLKNFGMGKMVPAKDADWDGVRRRFSK